MRILTYKRTHIGDPDEGGNFGIHDCMGSIRNWNYEAIIGVGGYGPEPKNQGIAGRVTWVGSRPHRVPHPHGYGLLVRFDNYILLDEHGPFLRDLAPHLARRIYEGGARVLFKSYSAEEQKEAEELVNKLLSKIQKESQESKSRYIAPSNYMNRCGK